MFWWHARQLLAVLQMVSTAATFRSGIKFDDRDHVAKRMEGVQDLFDRDRVRVRLHSGVAHGKVIGLWTGTQNTLTVDLDEFRRYMSEGLQLNPFFRFLVRIHLLSNVGLNTRP